MAERPFIECADQSVPEREAHDLLVWLNKPEAFTLNRIIESRARQFLAEAANAALQGSRDSPLKMNLADERLKVAARYLDFLEILKSIKEQTTPFTVNKWI